MFHWPFTVGTVLYVTLMVQGCRIDYVEETQLLYLTSESYGQKLFIWNKIFMNPQEYQNSYCHKKCNGTKEIFATSFTDVRQICLDTMCYPCTCDKPSCNFYGTCCPDISESLLWGQVSNKISELGTGPLESGRHHSVTKKGNSEILNKTSNQELDVRCAETNNSQTYMYIKSCPDEYPDSTVKSKCEKDIPFNEEDLSTFSRVTDTATSAVYYNEYCAKCNIVTMVSLCIHLYIFC